MNIKQLSEILVAAGQVVDIEQVEKVYSESFKSEPMPFKEIGLSKDQAIELVLDETAIYEQVEEWDYEDDMPYTYSVKVRDQLTREQAESIFDKIDYVCICNYKGEDEGGIVPAFCVTHLRTYISKHNYK